MEREEKSRHKWPEAPHKRQTEPGPKEEFNEEEADKESLLEVAEVK